MKTDSTIHSVHSHRRQLKKSLTRRLHLVSLFFVAIQAAVVNAGVPASISFSSRAGNGTSFATSQEYVENWNTLPTSSLGYGDAGINIWDVTNPVPVDNHDLIFEGSLVDIAYLYTVDLAIDPSQVGNYEIQVAPDFGLGGTVLLDGVAVALNSNDMWWDGDWSNTSQIFDFSSFLGVGNHTLQVYGQEACCDGPTAARYSTDGGANWTAFGAVPEPAAILLAGLGLAGLISVHFRRQVDRRSYVGRRLS